MPQSLLEMAKDLVTAQIQAGHVQSPDGALSLLHETYDRLSRLRNAESDSAATEGMVALEATPDWKSSIGRNSVVCLECGSEFKQLSSRHLSSHGLDGRSYRDKYHIPRGQSLAAKVVTNRRRQLAQASKPWEKTPTYRQAHPELKTPSTKAASKTKTAKPASRSRRSKSS